MFYTCGGYHPLHKSMSLMKAVAQGDVGPLHNDGRVLGVGIGSYAWAAARRATVGALSLPNYPRAIPKKQKYKIDLWAERDNRPALTYEYVMCGKVELARNC